MLVCITLALFLKNIKEPFEQSVFEEWNELSFYIKMINTFEFFLNIFTEFSDKNNIILKRLLGSNSLSPVWETEILPLCHRVTGNRADHYT